MPISREQVRHLCTGDEFELYVASLRLSLAGMPMDALRSCIRRAQELISKSNDQGQRKKPRKIPGQRIVPRKGDLLAGALSRFEGRLNAMETEAQAGRDPLP